MALIDGGALPLRLSFESYYSIARVNYFHDVQFLIKEDSYDWTSSIYTPFVNILRK
ncbi:MAG: hypothetical protein ACTS5A_02570 [Candidatus Hodgkinia cicadicola]